jgi:UDP-N-acetylglucosamine 2-epimerase (non-hydrolysing)
VNRLVIDALSDYLFTAGTRSNSVAAREQSDGNNTYMVGNILMDTLRFNHQRLVKPQISNLNPQTYFVFTLNRKALLADEEKLKQMLEAMVEAAGDTPIIAPLRGKAFEVVSRLKPLTSHLTPLTSLNYLEFGWLTANAKGIITDSGNVAEEATFNGVPCITLNSYTEHQETVTVGSNVLVGEDPQRLKEELLRIEAGQWKKCALPDRWDGRTAERIVQILLG